MLDRKEEHLATGNRPSAAARVKAGVGADGMLTAFDAESWGTGGAGAAAGFPLPYIYQFPNRRRTHKDVFINTGQQRPMRAPGHPQGCFITEVLMEELADAVKMDPVEFRIKNLPPEAPNAMWGDYLRKGAAEFGWDKRHPTGDKTPGPDQDRHGRGDQHLGRRRARSVAGALRDLIGRRGRHPRRHAGPRHRHPHDGRDRHGRHARPAGQRDQAGDRRHDVPDQRRIGRQHDRRRQSVPAVRIATVNALDALKEKVAPGARRRAGDAGRGRRPHPGQGRPVEGHGVGRRVQAARDAADLGRGQLAAGTVLRHHLGRAVCRSHGRHRNRHRQGHRVLAIQDCGLVVSRLTAESQVYGGVIGSLNFALFEDRILDRNTGQMVNPNMEWYLLAGMSDMPKIDVRLMDQPERGVIGIGEPPTVSTAAAITNAVRNAIGVTVRSLPLTPAKILQTLSQRQA